MPHYFPSNSPFPLTFILSPEGRGIFEERQRELWGNSTDKISLDFPYNLCVNYTWLNVKGGFKKCVNE
jgi:hypothetical protein